MSLSCQAMETIETMQKCSRSTKDEYAVCIYIFHSMIFSCHESEMEQNAKNVLHFVNDKLIIDSPHFATRTSHTHNLALTRINGISLKNRRRIQMKYFNAIFTYSFVIPHYIFHAMPCYVH